MRHAVLSGALHGVGTIGRPCTGIMATLEDSTPCDASQLLKKRGKTQFKQRFKIISQSDFAKPSSGRYAFNRLTPNQYRKLDQDVAMAAGRRAISLEAAAR